MDRLAQFYIAVQSAQTMLLATAAGPRVTLRVVSPVLDQGSVVFFTAPSSVKYLQLKENPNCCIGVGAFFAEAAAVFPGPVMQEQNAALRALYSAKFPGAFDADAPFNGRNAEFVRLRPTRLTGWAFADDAPDGIPSVPFAIDL